MADPSNTLLTECQLALGITQEDLGNIVGRTKRTVQRWQQRGATLLPSEAEALARALCPARPDLAERIASAAGTTLDALGIDPTQVSHGTATSNPIDSVVRAAADAMGLTTDAIRPAVAAAFTRAGELGMDVHAVAKALSESQKTSGDR
jgi:hypothetical protein